MAYVMIADDDPSCRSLIAMQIRGLGHEVGIATDGPSAVALASKRQADMVILDICMPGFDGFSAVRRIRQLAGYGETPILALTSTDDTFGVNETVKAGFTDLMFKPWQIRALEGRIRAMLG